MCCSVVMFKRISTGKSISVVDDDRKFLEEKVLDPAEDGSLHGHTHNTGARSDDGSLRDR